MSTTERGPGASAPDQVATLADVDAKIAAIPAPPSGGSGGASLEQKYADPLAFFRGVMSKRLASSPLTIAFRGSSSTAGNNASTDEARFVNKVMAKIRAAYPLASGSHPTGVQTLSAASSAPPSGAGIFGVNAGVSGSRTGTQGGSTPYVTSSTRQAVANLPGLRVVIDMIGANDAAGRSDLPANTPAVFKANLISEVEALKALMGSNPYTHIFVHSYPRFDAAAQQYRVAPWAEYLTALWDIAKAYPWVAVLNTADEWAQLGVTGAAGADPLDFIDTDDIHMNDVGHDAMADIVFRKLMTPQFVGKQFATTTPTAPTITTTALTSMVVNTAFSQTLEASVAGVSWSVDSGSLPAGLSLNTSTGAITGTPTATGSFTVTIAATNSAGKGTKTFTGSVAATGQAPVLSSSALPAMTQGAAYSQTIPTTGGTPTAGSVPAGSVPAGLTLALANGIVTLAGTPTGAGPYSFTLRVTNDYGFSEQTYTGTITAAASGLTRRVYDSFTRANATDVTGSSTESGTGLQQLTYQSSVAATFAIVDGALRAGTAAAGGSFVPWTGADYEVSGTVETLTNAASGTVWSLDGRRSGLSTSGVSQYRLTYSSSGKITLSKTVSGTSTILWESGTGQVAVGDVLALRMIGSSISAVKNGAILQTVTDSSVTTSAFAGFSRGSSNTGGWNDFALAS